MGGRTTKANNTAATLIRSQVVLIDPNDSITGVLNAAPNCTKHMAVIAISIAVNFLFVINASRKAIILEVC